MKRYDIGFLGMGAANGLLLLAKATHLLPPFPKNLYRNASLIKCQFDPLYLLQQILTLFVLHAALNRCISGRFDHNQAVL